MALNHVLMWTDANGWVPITALEAKRINPGVTIHVKSRMLLCGLCNKYVLKTIDGVLKHSRGDEDKECDERSKALSAQKMAVEKPSSLPMRLSGISASYFFLEIGFTLNPVLSDIHGTLSIHADNQPVQIYNISERLQYDTITYLKAGELPASEYRLHFSDARFEHYVPMLISGIDHNGTLFDGTTHKRLPETAVVSVGHTYLLLTREEIINTDIQTRDICLYKGWRIYEVTARKFNRNAADFFLKYRCLLSEKTVTLFPVWPAYIQTPYLIHHRTDTLHFFMDGQNVTPQVFPGFLPPPMTCEGENGKIITVHSVSRQQFISVGKTSILRYTYLWKDTASRQESIPVADVRDIMDQPVIQGESQLPKHNALIIRSSYDGYVEIIKDGFIIEKLSLKAETPCEVSGLQYGESLRVLQGADCVYQVEFRKIKLTSVSDDKLYQKLMKAGGKMIPVSHRLGSMAAYFYDVPDVKKWLYQRIRAGMMPEEAYKLLKDSVKGMKK